MKPLGLVVVLFGGADPAEPDLGTTISLCLMVRGGPRRLGGPAPPSWRCRLDRLALGAAAIWIGAVPARARPQLPRPVAGPAGRRASRRVQAIIGIGSGGITGEGLGQGVQKIFYLPEAHTDMIFAIIGEELGLVGSTLVIWSPSLVFALGGLPHRAALPRSVRQAARGRHHDARLRAGGSQPGGRPRASPR